MERPSWRDVALRGGAIPIDRSSSERDVQLSRITAVNSLGINLAVYVADNINEYAHDMAVALGSDEEYFDRILTEESVLISSMKDSRGQGVISFEGSELVDEAEDIYRVEFGVSNGLIHTISGAFKRENPHDALEDAAFYTAGFVLGNLLINEISSRLMSTEQGTSSEFDVFSANMMKLQPYQFAAGILYLIREIDDRPAMDIRQPLYYQSLSVPFAKRDLVYAASHVSC